MDLELHQLKLRYAELRVLERGRRCRLVASLAQQGQQTPVLVVADESAFVLIDGYARIAALEELGRDIVLATVLDLPEAEALILTHRLEAGRRRSALEEGWLISELLERHGLTQQAVAARLQRSKSWVSRRLALVQTLSEAVQAAVRSGLVPAYGAMKYLVVLARANTAQCDQLVANLTAPISVRALERIYRGWRSASAQGRERIVAQPELFLKADAAARARPIPDEDPVAPLLGELEGIAGLARRARRRVREGLLDELDAPRRALVGRTFYEAQHTFQTLTDLLRNPCSTQTPAPPS